MQKTYLELSESGGSAHKFYEVIVTDCELQIRYGRIGEAGRTQTSTFASSAQANAAAQKKIRAKLSKGYAPAVMGLRQRRPITRRSTESRRSTAQRAPILWQFDSGTTAFGISVDATHCWVGNQDGRVFMVDHDGQARRQFKLPEGVKCIVTDADWRYAGCDDGRVYDLSGKVPFVAYEIADDVDVYWLDIHDGMLGVSDAKGHIAVFDHEDESLWTAKSRGGFGWMLRADRQGLYHGHSAGVTMYDWRGEALWSRSVGGTVWFGWQEQQTVYCALAERAVVQLSKSGQVRQRYEVDDGAYSCAAHDDGRYLFVGDSASSIYCFDASGMRMWKLATGCGSALSMQYFQDRLYVVTTEGVLACIDASARAIEAAQQGRLPTTQHIPTPPKKDAFEVVTALPTTQAGEAGIELECYQAGAKLRIRPVSAGFNQHWNVQFPNNLRVLGARYCVDGLREGTRGGFYRVVGEIRRVR